MYWTPLLAGVLASSPPGPELAGWLRAARDHHPKLASASAARATAEARTGLAGSWPQPKVGLSVLPAPLETRSGPQRLRVGVEQTIPWFQRTEAELEGARAGLDAAKAEHAVTERRIAAALTTAYLELWRLHRQIETVQALIELRDQSLDVLRAETASGRPGASLALARVEAATARLRARLPALKGQLTVAEAGLRAAAGLSPEGEAAVGGLPANLPVAADQNHPLLGSARARLRRAEAERLAARAAAGPDVSVGATWLEVGARGDQPDSGADALLLTVGARLPLWWWIESSRREVADAAEVVAQRQSETTELGLAKTRTELARGEAGLEGRLSSLDEEALPAAERWVQMARAALAAEGLGYRELLDAEAEQLALELERIDTRAAKSRLHLARASLELNLSDLIAALEVRS